uniref:Peptidase S1 domain-containing protein n=1 Tax=Anopheles epiroticus TaxID=199890 RepID=A0A182PS87_9DIPT
MASIKLTLVTVICWASVSFACNCVPENLCPAPDVDLRFLDVEDNVCSTGMVCCEVLPVSGSEESSCDGVCVAGPTECSDEDYDEYGTDLIDIRTNNVNSCPGSQYCCRTYAVQPAPVPTCDGTCLPLSLCPMFQPGAEGCTGGNVCCRMDRNWWTEMINDINAMVEPNPAEDQPKRTCEWSRLRNETTVVPPWLLSVWARVEIIPGIQADQFICGGVLVDPSLILTAASCVRGLSAPGMFVNVGDYDISSRSGLRTENIYTVQEQIIHENYNTSDPVHNDVALLRLTTPIRDGSCVAPFASPPTSGCKAHSTDCYTIGWNRTLLGIGSALPKRYPVQVTSFPDDLLCPPSTICIDRDEGQCHEDESLYGSVIVCEEGESQAHWKVRGLLIRNCTGVASDSIATWLEHQRNPGFVQNPGPVDPSRQYLPVI